MVVRSSVISNSIKNLSPKQSKRTPSERISLSRKLDRSSNGYDLEQSCEHIWKCYIQMHQRLLNISHQIPFSSKLTLYKKALSSRILPTFPTFPITALGDKSLTRSVLGVSCVSDPPLSLKGGSDRACHH